MQIALDWPSPEHPAPQLCLLLHDRGGQGSDMLPLAEALRTSFGAAAIVAPDAACADAALGRDPQASGPRSWWAGDGHEAPAGTVVTVAEWVASMQRRCGASRAATLIAGCGQGADLALALAWADDGSAGRVLSFGGRLPGDGAAAPKAVTLHLLHAGDDPRLPAAQARAQLERLGEQQADATLDLLEGAGQPLHQALIDAAVRRLRSHIPLRTWRQAMGAAAGTPGAQGGGAC